MGDKNSFYTTEVQLYVTEQVGKEWAICAMHSPYIAEFPDRWVGGGGGFGADKNDSKTTLSSCLFIIFPSWLHITLSTNLPVHLHKHAV
jgi:hypothetical protein